MMTGTGARKGFRVCCPRCGDEGTISVNVADIRTLICSNCDVELTADDVHVILNDWATLLAWLETAPALD